jgi:hypothetical protein
MRPSFNLRPSSSMLSIFFKYAVNYPKRSTLPYIILRKLILRISSPKKNTPTFYRRLSNPTVSREVLGLRKGGLRSFLLRGVRIISRSVGMQLFLFLLNSSGSHFPHLEQKTAVMTQIDPINRTALTFTHFTGEVLCDIIIHQLISSPITHTIARYLVSNYRHKSQYEITRLPND